MKNIFTMNVTDDGIEFVKVVTSIPAMVKVNPKASIRVQERTITKNKGIVKKFNAPINKEIKKVAFDGGFCVFDTVKAIASSSRAKMVDSSKKNANRMKAKNNPTVIPAGYVLAKEFIKSLGYEEGYISVLLNRIPNIGDRLYVRRATYLSPKQQDILTAYRIETEKFNFSEFRKSNIEASKRGRAIGLQAQRFGENGITGNYFSDYVTEHFGSAQYERYVNRKERIDAFTVVDGVAHIIEFKTGNVRPMNHKEQVLRYAKGIRDEGYNNIKVSILYWDNRDQNVSFDVDVDVLDEDYDEVVEYIASIPSRVRGTV